MQTPKRLERLDLAISAIGIAIAVLLFTSGHVLLGLAASFWFVRLPLITLLEPRNRRLDRLAIGLGCAFFAAALVA